MTSWPRKLAPLAILVLSLVLLSVSCAPKNGGPTNNTPAARAPPPQQGLSKPEKARLKKILATPAAKRCGLVASVDVQQDKALVGELLEVAYRARRNETDRACWFKLLTAMRANAEAPRLMRANPSQERALAILAWAARNLRSKVMPDVLHEGLESDDARVRLSAAAKIGSFSPSAAVIKVLRQALEHSDKDVRLKAVRSATEMDHPEAAGALNQRGKVETDADVKKAIKRALSR